MADTGNPGPRGTKADVGNGMRTAGALQYAALPGPAGVPVRTAAVVPRVRRMAVPARNASRADVPGKGGAVMQRPGFPPVAGAGKQAPASASVSMPVSTVPAVWEWPVERKFAEVLQRAVPKLPGNMQREFEALLSPASLGVMTGTLVVWAASHAFGIGQIVDVLLFAGGMLFLGMSVFDVAGDFGEFLLLGSTAANEDELEQAATHIANAVAVIGVAGFVALLAKGARAKSGGTKGAGGGADTGKASTGGTAATNLPRTSDSSVTVTRARVDPARAPRSVSEPSGKEFISRTADKSRNVAAESISGTADKSPDVAARTVGTRISPSRAPTLLGRVSEIRKKFTYEECQRLAAQPVDSELHRAARERVSVDYYSKHMKNADGSQLSPAQIESHVAGIDMRKPVHAEKVYPGEMLYQYQIPPWTGQYFTRSPAALPDALGISDVGLLRGSSAKLSRVSPVASKQLNVHVVKEETTILRSTAAPIADRRSVPGQVKLTRGGSEQIVLPKSDPAQSLHDKVRSR